jgi:hypothetical protein
MNRGARFISIWPFVPGDFAMRSQLRNLLASLLVLVTGFAFATRAFAETDRLPSWNDGSVKKEIIEFVHDTTAEFDAIATDRFGKAQHPRFKGRSIELPINR